MQQRAHVNCYASIEMCRRRVIVDLADQRRRGWKQGVEGMMVASVSMGTTSGRLQRREVGNAGEADSLQGNAIPSTRGTAAYGE